MSITNVHIAHEYEINQVPRTILYTTGVTTFTHTQLVMICGYTCTLSLHTVMVNTHVTYLERNTMRW